MYSYFFSISHKEKKATPQVDVKDRELLRYFEAIDQMGEKEKQTVKEILNLVLVQKKVKELANG
ncbi:hypothetical protein LEP1GSC021_5072 [Leptospira noguchii str. 1993005606]|nr:hypothetical protein LEP1GSC021_5072 [Leptospira noguchii str. 1993005606]